MTSATPAERLPRARDPSDASEHRNVTRWLSRQDRASRRMADRGSREETRANQPFEPPRAAGTVAAGQSGVDPAPTGAPRDPHRAARVALGKRPRLDREGEAEPSGSRTPFVSMARACSSRSDEVSSSEGVSTRDEKARESENRLFERVSKKTPEDVRAALDPRDIDEGVAWLRQCHARLTQIVAASVVARARARVAARGAREAARGAEASRREETSSSARREAMSTDAFLLAAAEPKPKPKPLLLARDTAVGPDPDPGCARLRPFTLERRASPEFGNGTGTNPASYRVGGLGADEKSTNDETEKKKKNRTAPRETAAALAARARADRLFVDTNTTHTSRHKNETSPDAKTAVTSHALGTKNGRLGGSPLRGAAGVIRLREAQTLFRVDRSRVHGLGVFSRAFVPRDTPVMEYIGEVVRRPVADRREEAAERVFLNSSTYMFSLDENDADSRVVDATRKGNLARFANHSCAPNCLAKSVVLANERRVVLFTTRDVRRGEELTYDYQFAPEIPERETPCACGAETCRGVINVRAAGSSDRE